ncbi:porin family protein [Thioalkalivibrio sp. AKL7]|uniref:porin family protein n=1 Tax=Thioalkalivibrio sp. AKL7 TaxID=1158155 RepID=UPI00035F66D1|nr:porin family protein [Thioalkalivibrio sp. AKL7]
MKKILLNTVVVAAAGILAPQVVMADESDRSEGLYMGLGTGFSALKNDRDEVADFIGSGASDYRLDDDDNVWRGFVGYNFNPYVGVEGFYSDLGKVKLRGDESGAHTDIKSRAYGASVLGKLPIGQHFEFFAKAGLAKWDADVRGNLGDESITLRDNDGVDPVYGLGAQVNLDSFLIRAEYERYDFDSDYKVDAFTASVGWRF